MKILKKEVVEKRGEEETKSMPHAPTGARGVRKKKQKKLYNTTRGRTHLLPFF